MADRLWPQKPCYELEWIVRRRVKSANKAVSLGADEWSNPTKSACRLGLELSFEVLGSASSHWQRILA